MSVEWRSGSTSSEVKPESSSMIRCCLMPWKPIVLLIRKLPCASSGKCRELTISQPEVGLTIEVKTFIRRRLRG